jgi:phosphoserine phosphatase RsbU/P
MKDLSESRVLIVDDVPANVDVLVQALRGTYQLSVAVNGASALATAEKLLPDLVLLDIVMPGVDGYEVCRRLRASPRTREIPVMFLSSLEDVQHKAKGFEAGGNDYLVKPFEIVEVKARVKSLLRAKAYVDGVKEQMAHELRIAREIQMGILPLEVASVTEGTGLEAHAVMCPAQEVGGDLYEILRLANGNLLVVTGDVSGKGMPAALLMAVTMTLVRSMAADSPGPAEVLRRISDALALHNPQCMFVTLLSATYNVRTGRLDYASAGHPPPVLVQQGVARPLPLTPGVVAGVMPGLSAPPHSVQLAPGDLVVFYTDGVTEAFDASENLYGEARLLQELSGKADPTPVSVTSALLQSVRAHAGEAPQSDDITVLALRRKL